MPPKTSKKSGKGKERKLKRKQEQAEIALAWTKVKDAYGMGDFMDTFVPFRKFNRNGLTIDICYKRVHDMKEDDIEWCFKLLRDNMKPLYISAGWGWNDRDKIDELRHDSSCFLLARDAITNNPVGFICFRFDLDQDIEVLYCYEIQLISDIRRKGLGKFMMQILELIAHKACMKKVILTVFKENIQSNRFFHEKIGYDEDESSPGVFDPLNPEEYSYSILSKTLYKPNSAPVLCHKCDHCSTHSDHVTSDHVTSDHVTTRTDIEITKAEQLIS